MNFAHAPWLPMAFYQRVKILVSRDEITDPLGLLGTWMSESGLRPDAINHSGGATGLFQAMPQTIAALGIAGSSEAFARLDAATQAGLAELYYRPYKGKLRTGALCYLATFLPAYLVQFGLDQLTDDLVITAKTGPLPWAYAANAVFDENRDYAITIGELADAITRNAHGPIWDEAAGNLAELLSLTPPAPTVAPPAFDLRTTRGIQEALARLMSPGLVVDGIPGKQTRGAVYTWQLAHGLKGDGIPGPITRASLRDALIAIGCTPGSSP